MVSTTPPRCVLVLALSCAALLLHGCGNDSAEVGRLRAKIKALEDERVEDCQEKCRSSAAYGRWHSDVYGHVCLREEALGPSLYACVCSPSAEPPRDCNGTQSALVDVHEHRSKASAAAAAQSRGSPRETIHEFCDGGGLTRMHGHGSAQQEEAEGMTPAHQLESAILNDVAKELETNNVDRMAKEIFTFYVCVRWIPDDIFWEIAKQELAAELVQGIVDHNENLEQVVAELYQRYKFVPLLCSKNLEVYGKTEDEHHTYFGQFEQDAKAMARWMQAKRESPVGRELTKIDTIFCGGDQMNAATCNAALDFKEWVNKVTSWSGLRFDTKKDKWEVMQSLFLSFKENMADGTWARDIHDWKGRFPYHSFIDKPGGMPSDMSPTASQRFLVCFGKRVASEMHRRPNGQHIMTDQNNIGCHGWWDADQASGMLDRMVALWRPPTCQLADMVYTMKKQLLSMFTQMNERLFDALPTMLMDEELDQQQLLEEHVAGPGPYNPSSVHDGEFVDGMRVSAMAKIKYPPACDDGFFMVGAEDECDWVATPGTMGTVEIAEGELAVLWDGDHLNSPRAAAAGQVHIMPHAWQGHKSVSSRMRDLVAGISSVSDRAKELFSAMFRKKYQGLAVMMTDSTSKWIVCPVRGDASLDDLDSHLGVEDAAFQDFRKEAYGKWTGHQAKVPGEECAGPDFLGGSFGRGRVCEISELHADHVEKYFRNGTQEDFICPVRLTLPPDEQLAVLAEKRDTCFLRMTDEQARHYSWRYAGDFPARRQNDKMPNPPRAEFELVKLLKVPHDAGDSEVSFGRYCSLEELVANPRFCDTPQTFNPWPTLNEMAEHMAGTVAGSLGVGAAALQGTLAAFQKGLGNASDTAGRVALNLGEHAVDGLFGTGRLLYKSGKFALAHLGDDLPGQGRRRASLQEQLFGSSPGGPLLHGLSFQRPLGRNGLTSNAKGRFQRFVVAYPCGGFDPALHFSLRREWGSIARRMVREAKRQVEAFPGQDDVLGLPTFEMLLRGEARVFEDTGNREAGNRTFPNFGASVQVTHVHRLEEVKCSGNLVLGCEPSDRCERSGLGCAPKTVWDPDSWSLVHDQLLAKVVGALDVASGSLANLHGIKLTLYCGEKERFRPAPGSAPAPRGNETLLGCLRRGVKENARLHAREPWKLFFKGEVVVVAVFDEIVGHWCNPEAGIPAYARAAVCANSAAVDPLLGKHLAQMWRRPALGRATAAFRGFYSGAGYPRGAPREVVMRPEDILEAVGMLVPPPRPAARAGSGGAGADRSEAAA